MVAMLGQIMNFNCNEWDKLCLLAYRFIWYETVYEDFFDRAFYRYYAKLRKTGSKPSKCVLTQASVRAEIFAWYKILNHVLHKI